MQDWRVRYWYTPGTKAYDKAKSNFRQRGGEVVVWQDNEDCFCFDVKKKNQTNAEIQAIGYFLETREYPGMVEVLLLDFVRTGKPKGGVLNACTSKQEGNRAGKL